MGFDLRRVNVQRPCPSESAADQADPDAASFHCDSCDKSVHVLSNMTEREAAAMLGSLEGQSICIRYRADAEGRIHFASRESEALVPVAALAPARGRQRRATAVAAAGLSAALAACTPHDHPEHQRLAMSELETAEAPSPAPLVRDAVVTPAERGPTDGEVSDVLGVELESERLRARDESAELEERVEGADDAPCDGRLKRGRKKVNLGTAEMGLFGL